MTRGFGGQFDSPILRHVRRGHGFVMCTGVVESAVGAGVWRVVLTNPATSGRNVILERIDVCTDLGTGVTPGSMNYLKVVVNPTTNLPSISPVTVPAYNLNFSSPVTSATTLKWDLATGTEGTVAMAGGIPTKLAYPAGLNKSLMQFQMGPLVIPPGLTVGFNAPYSSSRQGSAFLYFTEESVIVEQAPPPQPVSSFVGTFGLSGGHHVVHLDRNYHEVEVMNLDGIGELYVRRGPDTPQTSGPGALVMPPGVGVFTFSSPESGETVVSVRSEWGQRYSVRGLD